jgi:hypothetical protein
VLTSDRTDRRFVVGIPSRSVLNSSWKTEIEVSFEADLQKSRFWSYQDLNRVRTDHARSLFRVHRMSSCAYLDAKEEGLDLFDRGLVFSVDARRHRERRELDPPSEVEETPDQRTRWQSIYPSILIFSLKSPSNGTDKPQSPGGVLRSNREAALQLPATNPRNRSLKSNPCRPFPKPPPFNQRP